MDATATLAGMDRARLEAWMAEHVGAVAPLDAELVAAGRSNLTYVVRDARGETCVLRRPPHGELLPSAHDMAREFRVLSALTGTPVPVPRPLALAAPGEVGERAFYVMERRPGVALRTVEDVVAILDEETRVRAARSLVETLVALHAVDASAGPVERLGKGVDYLRRQIAIWGRQYRAGAEPFGRVTPEMVDVEARLLAAVPEQRETRVVHGDYRLDNVLMSPEGRVTAVLDWELCTRGDPLADVGILLAYWPDERAPELADVVYGAGAPGMPTAGELVDWYAELSGRDLEPLPYYIAFAHWKNACVIEGVVARYRTNGGGGAVGGEELADRVGLLAGVADARLRDLGM